MIEALSVALARFGFILRGGFSAEPSDGLPNDGLPNDGLPGTGRASVLMVGNVGGSMWRAFDADPSVDRTSENPLDDWTRARIQPIAAEFGALAVFPFGGPPYLPFQRWAMRAEPVHPSPLGILIHPRYGLWHAYRAALVIGGTVDVPPREAEASSPCRACADKPCLSTCPVGAFTRQGYDVAACAGHVRGPLGADCRNGGCLARRACPIGAGYAYPPEEGAFHMAAFLARH